MDKVSYALGVSVGHNLLSSGIKDLNLGDFSQAVETMLQGKEPALSFDEINNVLNEFFGKLEQAKKAEKEAAKEKNLKEGEFFLAANKQKEGVICLESGLQYEILQEGNGEKPAATDKVKCHYHGTLIDGTVFDSSVQRNQPATFGVSQVIPGWVEALQLMSVGSKWRLFIPSHLAYGPNGAGGSIGPNATLIFEVELLGIEK